MIREKGPHPCDTVPTAGCCLPTKVESKLLTLLTVNASAVRAGSYPSQFDAERSYISILKIYLAALGSSCLCPIHQSKGNNKSPPSVLDEDAKLTTGTVELEFLKPPIFWRCVTLPIHQTPSLRKGLPNWHEAKTQDTA